METFENNEANTQHQWEISHFSAPDHLDALIKDTGIKCDVWSEVDYPLGFQPFIEAFVEEVKELAFELDSIKYEDGNLEVDFQIQGLEEEVKVWRAVNLLRHRCKNTCEVCGALALPAVHGKKWVAMCIRCSSKLVDETTKTGTWLDKF